MACVSYKRCRQDDNFEMSSPKRYCSSTPTSTANYFAPQRMRMLLAVNQPDYVFQVTPTCVDVAAGAVVNCRDVAELEESSNMEVDNIDNCNPLTNDENSLLFSEKQLEHLIEKIWQQHEVFLREKYESIVNAKLSQQLFRLRQLTEQTLQGRAIPEGLDSLYR